MTSAGSPVCSTRWLIATVMPVPLLLVACGESRPAETVDAAGSSARVTASPTASSPSPSSSPAATGAPTSLPRRSESPGPQPQATTPMPTASEPRDQGCEDRAAATDARAHGISGALVLRTASAASGSALSGRATWRNDSDAEVRVSTSHALTFVRRGATSAAEDVLTSPSQSSRTVAPGGSISLPVSISTRGCDGSALSPGTYEAGVVLAVYPDGIGERTSSLVRAVQTVRLGPAPSG